MNVRLRYDTPVSAGIWYNDQLMMNTYQLSLKLITTTGDPAEHNIALERIKYFIHSELNSTVFINVENEDQCSLLAEAGVGITTLPEEPIDQIVGIVLFSKFNAIMEGRMVLTELEVSSELGENIVYLHSEAESLGSFAEFGWWSEPTIDHCDYEEDSDNTIEVLKNNQWRELELEWPSASSSKKDNTVVFAKFDKDETK